MDDKKTTKEQISKEKAEKYVHNRKVRDEQRRQDRKRGDVTDRRLSFLENILKMRGLTWKQVSTLCGISPQMLSWYITKDDCYLSVLKNILASLGIETKISLSNNNKHKPVRKYQYQVVGNIMNFDTEKGSMVDKYPPFIKDCINANGQMKWLADYIVDNNYQIKNICTRIGITESTLRYYFTQNDMKVSRIFQIAGSLEEKIIWELNETKN